MTKQGTRGVRGGVSREQIQDLSSADPIAGVPGPGRWLVFDYLPTALFSLKMSLATSSVGKSLLVPTPYAIKMSIVDAALRTGWGRDVGVLVRELAKTGLRIGVPERATVTHTIVKIRQEPKDKKQGPPYISAVAYREFVHYRGLLRWAFDMTSWSDEMTAAVIDLAPAVNYIGKRGSFIQYVGVSRLPELTAEFTQPVMTDGLRVISRAHITTLDDFGPDANLDALNSYNDAPIKRDRHRKFVETVVPLGVVNVGPGFTEYCWAGSS